MKSKSEKKMLDAYSKLMFGENAINIPIRMIIQDAGEGVVSFIGAIKDKSLRFGSTMPHQFVIGDAIIRPHLVMESKHLVGVGLGGIVTSNAFCEIGEWVENGNTVLDPMNIIKDRKY